LCLVTQIFSSFLLLSTRDAGVLQTLTVGSKHVQFPGMESASGEDGVSPASRKGHCPWWGGVTARQGQVLLVCSHLTGPCVPVKQPGLLLQCFLVKRRTILCRLTRHLDSLPIHGRTIWAFEGTSISILVNLITFFLLGFQLRASCF
jgi:hypothetical protein